MRSLFRHTFAFVHARARANNNFYVIGERELHFVLARNQRASANLPTFLLNPQLNRALRLHVVSRRTRERSRCAQGNASHYCSCAREFYFPPAIQFSRPRALRNGILRRPRKILQLAADIHRRISHVAADRRKKKDHPDFSRVNSGLLPFGITVIPIPFSGRMNRNDG